MSSSDDDLDDLLMGAAGVGGKRKTTGKTKAAAKKRRVQDSDEVKNLHPTFATPTIVLLWTTNRSVQSSDPSKPNIAPG